MTSKFTQHQKLRICGKIISFLLGFKTAFDGWDVLKPSGVNTNSDLDRFLISIVFSVSDSTLRTDSDFDLFLLISVGSPISGGTLRTGSDPGRFCT